MIWIPITLIAALIQTIRNGLQKQLAHEFSFVTITWVRFFYAIPFFLLGYICLRVIGNLEPLVLNASFMGYALLGSAVQIIGNGFLTALFRQRNFVIGMTFSQSETILVMLFGWVLFAEYVSFFAAMAVLVGLIGILVITVTDKQLSLQSLWKGFFQSSGLLGVGAGACFALTTHCIRQASLSLEMSSFMIKAFYVSTVLLIIQLTILTLWMVIAYRKDMVTCLRDPKRYMWIGVTHGLGSIGWTMALGLTQAIYVAMVSKVSILYSIIITKGYFKEAISKREWVGIILVTAGILMVLADRL